MQNKPHIISGGKHSDDRGELIYFNDFDMSAVKRFYQISIQAPVSNNQIRAWQGHRIEEKYFYVNQGEFLIAAVQIDNWENPSKNLIPEIFILKSDIPQVLHLPAGYANGIRPLKDNSILTVYSTLTLEESLQDDYRFDKELWLDWES